ncbi:MAG TPA: hypothetical protein VM529_26945 [Gemmata sp.]|nr:hypothetical protein [Gemmata sp.]
MAISITEPTSNSTVPSAFAAKGTFTAGAGGGNIQITVYESNGTTQLPNTTVFPAGVMVPPGTGSGNWSVSVSRIGAYNGAIIKATLVPYGGGTPDDALVTGINITSGGGTSESDSGGVGQAL